MNRSVFASGRSAVSKSIAGAVLLMLLIALCQQSASAQYLTSTRAGFVNRVEGRVFIQRAGNELSDAGRASLGTQMKDGDQLITTTGSRAEILLSPGSYLRLDGTTRVRAISTRFSAMRFEVLSGSVIAEVSAEENATIKRENPLEIVTPHGTVNIARTGVYRFDVKDKYTNATTYNGELYLGAREQLLARTATKVGRGRVARLTGNGPAPAEIAKADSDVTDSFFDWSFQRAETLVAAHRSVLSRASSLTSLSNGWIFDPFYNCYTWIPFGRRFYTGYGFGFYSSFSACGCNNWGYWYPYYGSGPYNSAGTGYGSSLMPSVAPRLRGETDRSTTVVREVSVGRRVDVAPAPVHSPGLNSRGVDAWGASAPTRSWGGGSINSAGSDRTFGSPAVSPGRVDSGAGRTVDGGSAGGGRSAGGRGVNPH